MPSLRLKTGNDVRDVPLKADDFRVGRTPDNDLEVPSGLVSRRQASIVHRDGQYTLFDLGSANGTFVNGEKIDRRVLADGDLLRFGDVEVLFVMGEPEKGVPLPRGKETSTRRKDKTDSLPAPFGGSEIIQHVDDIAEEYDFDIQDALAKGVSLRSIRRQVSGERAAREGTMFYLLYQIGKQLSAAPTLDQMLRESMRLIFDVIPAGRGVVLLHETKAQQLVPALAYQAGTGVVETSLGISRTIAEQVFRERKSVIMSDALHDPSFMSGLSIVQHNIRSVLCVPLWEAARTYGVIYLDHLAKSYAFTKDDLELLTAIGNLIAIRIQQDELREKLRQEEVRRVNLSRYHSPDVVDLLVARGAESGLPMEEREVTILFVDVESSTKLSEQMGSAQVAALLSVFFEMATTAVFAHRGHVNKFIGDCVMAIFNAPADVADHALAAVETGKQILQELARHNVQNPQRVFNVRIGINTGPVIVGDVETRRLKEYTALGDPVNVAARLVTFPQVNRIIVGERTYTLLKGRCVGKDLGEVVLRGREKPLRAYEIEA